MVSCAGLAWDGQIVASYLNDNLDVVHAEVLKTACDRPPLTAGAEDPRLFTIKDKVYLTYNVTRRKDETWKDLSGRIVLCEFDPDNLRISKEMELNSPFLSKVEKNWMFFDNHGFICFVYSIHRMAKIGMIYQDSVRLLPKSNQFVKWPHGQPRGSSPAILVGDEYYAMIHSHCVESGIRHYVAGMFTFKVNPFKICRKTDVLLYPPKENEGLGPLPHQVVFPCGLALHDGLWYTSYGVNDYECRISAFNQADIERELQPV